LFRILGSPRCVWGEGVLSGLQSTYSKLKYPFYYSLNISSSLH
jgi:hypothetical protein